MELQALRRTAFLFLVVVVHWTLASPLFDHNVFSPQKDCYTHVRVRQNGEGFVAITGITDTGLQPRLEIREMQKDADMINVFILGLRRLMRIDQSEKLSYYQLAGIHGRPYISWDSGNTSPTTGSSGYCTHDSNLFLTWHRAYLVLFEQVLFDNIINVVNDFPVGSTRQRYASAAMRWRLPYWDWAALPADGETYPFILQNSTIVVSMPNGSTTIPNPLFSYKFHPVTHKAFFFDPWASWHETLRNPTNLTRRAVSNNAALGPILNNLRSGMMNRLYNLFTYYNNYTQFGNEAWKRSDFGNADSLESLHAVVHNTVGNQGQMTYFDFSAYDPVFWLHHAMIDRCFALWQAVHPDSRMENMTAIAPSFAHAVGDPETPTTPLSPFHKDISGTVYTSVNVWDHTKFGYTYPELMGKSNAQSVKAAINNLYGSDAVAGKGSLHFKAGSQAAGASYLEAAPGAVVEGRRRIYLANIVSQKFALNGSYVVYIFLGKAGGDATQWPLSSNLVGVHDVFAGLGGHEKADRADFTVAGSVPLTDGLLAKTVSGELKSMDSNTVAGYLHGKMQWCCKMLNGTPVYDQDLPDLSVTVISAEMAPAVSVDQFPTWSNFTKLRKATEGRTSGCPR